MKKPNPTQYTLRLLRRLLAGEKITVEALVAEGPFSDDTVRRRLASLEGEFPGVIRDGKWRSCWRYVPLEEAPQARFALLAVRMAHTLLSALRGSEIDAQLARLAEHLFSRASTQNVTPHDISRMFFSKSRMINPLGISPDIVDRMAQAIFEQRRMFVTYQHFSGQVNDMEVEPYSLIFADQGMYLYGRCEDSNDPKHIDTRRPYNLERFRSVTLSREHFVYPPRDDYDPETLFGNCFGIFLPPDPMAEPVDVMLRFNARWHSFLKIHRWHKSQSVPLEAADGGVYVQFRLHTTHDLVRWVRSLGKDVYVLEPLELRKWVEGGQDP